MKYYVINGNQATTASKDDYIPNNSTPENTVRAGLNSYINGFAIVDYRTDDGFLQIRDAVTDQSWKGISGTANNFSVQIQNDQGQQVDVYRGMQIPTKNGQIKVVGYERAISTKSLEKLSWQDASNELRAEHPNALIALGTPGWERIGGSSIDSVIEVGTDTNSVDCVELASIQPHGRSAIRHYASEYNIPILGTSGGKSPSQITKGYSHLPPADYANKPGKLREALIDSEKNSGHIVGTSYIHLAHMAINMKLPELLKRLGLGKKKQ